MSNELTPEFINPYRQFEKLGTPTQRVQADVGGDDHDLIKSIAIRQGFFATSFGLLTERIAYECRTRKFTHHDRRALELIVLDIIRSGLPRSADSGTSGKVIDSNVGRRVEEARGKVEGIADQQSVGRDPTQSASKGVHPSGTKPSKNRHK